MNRNRLPKRSARAGMAPLEFVMSLPFLLGLFAMLLSVGFVSLKRGAVVANARREVWKMRADSSSQSAGLAKQEVSADKPLSLTNINNETAGMVYGEATGDVRVFSWLNRGDNVTTSGRNAVLAGSWDHRQLDDFEQNGPHISILERMIGGNGDVSKLVVGFLGAILGGSLPNQGDIDKAGKEAEKAEAEAKKARQKLVDEIKRLEKELAELQQQRAALVQQKVAKQTELANKEDELDDLEEQASNQNPVSPALKAKIEQAKKDIKKLKDDIKDLDQQIKQKDIEIKAKEEELEIAREALKKADEEIGKLPGN